MKHLITIALMTTAISAHAFDLNSVKADQIKVLDTDIKAVSAAGHATLSGTQRPYGQDENKVWLPFSQVNPNEWTTSENDPFANDRIEVNVRKSGFGDDYDVDLAAGSDREMGSIRRVFSSDFEYSSGMTRIRAEKRLDTYIIEGFVRVGMGKNINLNLNMEKDFSSDNYTIKAPGLTLSLTRFGMVGEVTDHLAYPKKALAVIAAMSMGIFQAPANGF
ncbi:MAG TPA: hypothetical protein DCL44_02835 [Elusimicrobia bacterium]|nr:hypothetical protein [Elusimicrobiota bacterium]